MRQIRFDIAVEVSKEELSYLLGHYSGIIAWRQDGERFYIKCWFMKYAGYIETFLNS